MYSPRLYGAHANAQGACKMIVAVRERSRRSLHVNVFCHQPAQPDLTVEAAWLDYLRPHFAKLHADPPLTLKEIYESFMADDANVSLRRVMAGALGVLMVLFGSSSPIFAEASKPLTAILLVAKPDLSDDDFANSVVLVMNTLGAAPVGIVVNRPTRFTVAELFPDVRRLARLHDKVYFGGPVEFGVIWFLVRAPTPPEHAMPAVDGVYLSADRELLMKLLGRPKPMDGLRIFIGHAAWAPGQLESEIDRGAWTLERANPNAIFDGKSEHLWPAPRVLVPKDTI